MLRPTARLPLLAALLTACPAEVQPPPALEPPPASAVASEDPCAGTVAARDRAASLLSQGFVDRALRTLDSAPACAEQASQVGAQRAELLAQLGRCEQARKAGASTADLAACTKGAAETSDALLTAARAARASDPKEAQRLLDRATSALERELGATVELLDAPHGEVGLLQSEDGSVAVTNQGDLLISTGGLPPDRWRAAPSGFDSALALSPDGKSLVVRFGSALQVVDVATLKVRSTMAQQLEHPMDYELTPGGGSLLVIDGYDAFLFDTDTGASLAVVREQFESSGSGFYRSEVTAGGRAVLLQMLNEGTRILDADTGTALISRDRNGPWSFTDDGRYALTCEGHSDDDVPKYVVFDLQSKGKVKPPLGTPCYAPEFADGRGYLLLLDKQDKPSYFDVRTGKKVSELPPEPPPPAAAAVAKHPLVLAYEAVRKGRGVVGRISHDARVLEVDGDLTVDLETGQPSPLRDASASCDTRFGSCEKLTPVPGGVSVCPTGREPCSFIGLTHAVTRFARSRSGERVIAWDDKKLSIIDLVGLKVLGDKVFAEKVFDADFTGSGAQVEAVVDVIAGKSITRFDARSGKELGTTAFAERYDDASIVRGGMGTIIDVFDQKTVKLVAPEGVILWEQAFGQANNPWWYWPDGSVLLVGGTPKEASAFKLPGGELLGVFPRRQNTKLVGHYVASAASHAGVELLDVLDGGARTVIRNFGKGDYLIARGSGAVDQPGGANARVVLRGALAEQALTCRFGTVLTPFEVCRGRFISDSLARP